MKLIHNFNKGVFTERGVMFVGIHAIMLFIGENITWKSLLFPPDEGNGWDVFQHFCFKHTVPLYFQTGLTHI